MIIPLLLLTVAHQDKVVWLESLDLTQMHQDWGSAQARLSLDKHPITLNGSVYEHGVGTHANSSFTLNLKKGALKFSSDVGVDDETKKSGSVRFEIWVDGKCVAQSSTIRGGEPRQHLEASLVGAKRLELLVSDADGSIDYDHADWANAMLTVKPGASIQVMPAPPAEPTMKISMGVSDKPELNGARVVGCSPGKPFFYKIPASGKGPLMFKVTGKAGLPKGLRQEPSTGFLFGTVEEPGTYDLNVTVSGPKGEDHRNLTIVCGEHKLALTPPMGWNSWNVWGTSVTAAKIKAAADSFIKENLINYGYRYVNIDDAWEGSRDANGEVQTNEKFGDMAELAKYVHTKGLRLGIYSSPGPKTCAGYEGTYKHEFQDARTYGKWGIDYLKYDWCSYGEIAPQASLDQMKAPYILMRKALDESGRDIVFSLCQYGMGDVFNWGKEIGGNLWRTTGDITDSYSSMSSIAFAHSEKAAGASPGGWNDPDMLVVGRLGWGDNPKPTRLNGNEQITHITMWSLLAAPLILGCDLTKLDPFTKALITNHDVIEVDQDPLGKAATRVLATGNGAEVWARPLWDGSVAVGLMNRSTVSQRITVSMEKLGLKGSQPVRNLWTRSNLRPRDEVSAKVPAHGAMLFRVGRISK